MDIKQFEYVIAINNAGTISKAAEELYMTQSGLSQQLLKIEKEIGARLFERDQHHMQLTKAGNLFIQAGTEIVAVNHRMQENISDLTKCETGSISLGLTAGYGVDLFLGIYSDFRRVYPGISFQLKENMTSDMKSEILNYSLDMAVTSYDENQVKQFTNLRHIKIFEDPFAIGINKNHSIAQKYTSEHPEGRPTLPITVFKDEQFAYPTQDATMRPLVDSLFAEAGLKPNIQLESGVSTTSLRFISTGYGCAIMPKSRAISIPDDNIVWFELYPTRYWVCYILMRPDINLTSAERFFLELAVQYGKRLQEQL